MIQKTRLGRAQVGVNSIAYYLEEEFTYNPEAKYRQRLERAAASVERARQATEPKQFFRLARKAAKDTRAAYDYRVSLEEPEADEPIIGANNAAKELEREIKKELQ